MEEAKDMHPQGVGSTEPRQHRLDDRNEELDESPVPDPEAGETSADDVPEAD